MTMLDFIRENFLHALPILLAGTFAVAIMAERARALFSVYPMKDPTAFLEQVRSLVLQGKTSEAAALCESHGDKPLAKVVKSAIIRADLPEELIEQNLEIEIGEARGRIQRRTAFLATIANVATLLGLFGTILGLIHSFEAVGHADAQQKSALLAAGIATSMNATMMGLGVAIPSMVAFSFLINRSNGMIAELEQGALRTLDMLRQRFYVPRDEKPRDNGKDHGKVVSIEGRKSA